MNSPALGVTYDTTTCVRVVWPWLTLPIVLVVMSGVFLALTIWKSKPGLRNDSVPNVWKSSIFAVLYHGLSEDARLGPGAVSRLDDMKAAAEHAQVKLTRMNKDWRLVLHDMQGAAGKDLP